MSVAVKEMRLDGPMPPLPALAGRGDPWSQGAANDHECDPVSYPIPIAATLALLSARPV